MTLLVAYRHRISAVASRLTAGHVYWVSAITFIVITVAFLAIYPALQERFSRIGGAWDADEAIDLATTELLHGRYPYYPKTFDKNPITPLPGALVLAIPFVLLGNGAYQNIFWLFVFFAAMTKYLHSKGEALLLVWIILALSPVVLFFVLVGSDYVANSVYVMCFVMWTVAAAATPNVRRWKAALPPVLLGIGLSSRPHFPLIMPLVFFAVARAAGWPRAMKTAMLTAGTFALITLPFYAYDPQGFSPLHIYRTLGQFDRAVPNAGLVIPSLTAALGIVLGLLHLRSSRHGNIEQLLGLCAIVLAVPVVSGLILHLMAGGRLDFARFGTFFLFFGAAALYRGVLHPWPDSSSSR